MKKGYPLYMAIPILLIGLFVVSCGSTPQGEGAPPIGASNPSASSLTSSAGRREADRLNEGETETKPGSPAMESASNTPQPPKTANLNLNDPLPLDPAVTVGRLANDLTYYIRSNARPAQRAELRLVVNAGSVLEEEDQRGLAHFLEHMAFNGTESFAAQELVDYLESIGMRFGPDLNAYTNYDETVYLLQVPTDDEQIVRTGLRILEEWAHKMRLEDREVEQERGVVIEEWRLGRGAEARIRDEQFEVLFQGSRYAERRPIGMPEVIRTFQPETLRRFYRDWYRPDLIAVVAVGDFEVAWMEAQIREIFSRIPAAKTPRERTLYPIPGNEQTLVAIASDTEATSSRVSVTIKHPVSPFRTVGDYRRNLVEGLYNNMLNQRLHELTRQPDPPFLEGYSAKGRIVRPNEFYILGARVSDNGLEKGLEALLVESERVKRFGFTPGELAREKAEMLKRIERAYNERDKMESQAFASEYIRLFLEDEAAPGLAFEHQVFNRFIPEINLEEVNRLAGSWLTDENRVVLASSPEKPGIDAPGREELLGVFRQVAARQIVPYLDRVSDQPLVPTPPRPGAITGEKRYDSSLGIIEWTLSNGARVILKPTTFKNDQILFSGYSPGGTSVVADKDYIPARTAADIVQEGGVGQFSKIELEKKLAGKTVSVNPWIEGLFEGVGGNSTPRDLETMLQLVYLYFTAPRVDPSAFQSYRQRLRASIENRLASPEAEFYDEVLKTLTQNHLRARPWEIEMLGQLDMQASLRIYRERFADAGDFTFFLVGNFTPDEVRPLVETWLAGLPANGRQEMWRDVGIEYPQGVINKTVHKGVEPKSRVHIAFNGSFQWAWENVVLLKALSEVLDIRMREKLREDKGGTYNVGIWDLPSHYPKEEYEFHIGFGTAPEQAEALRDLVFEDLRQLKRDGPAEGALSKVKEILRRERETNLKENEFWLNVLRSYDIHRQDFRKILEYDQLVRGITTEDLKQAARRYLSEERYVQVILYPQTGVGTAGP
jgi:zinc protease